MNRRQIVTSLGATVITGGLAGCSDLADEFPVLNSFAGPIESLDWKSEDRDYIEIELEEDHDADHIVLHHEAEDWDEAFWVGDAPRFSGPKKIPIRQEISCSSADWPSPVFEISLVEGDVIEFIGYAPEAEKMVTEEFDVGEDWLAETEDMDTSWTECWGV